MPIAPPLLAHAGPGASWQALVAVLGVLTALLFLLTVTRVVKINEPNDLVLPLSGVVIVSSLGTSASESLSDQVGWALPLGVVALVALVLYASRGHEAWPLASPWTAGAVGVAVIASVALQAPLTTALHPPPVEFDPLALPIVDDLRVTIVQPEDRADVDSPFTLVVELTGGSVGRTVADPGATVNDPEEGGVLRVLDGARILVADPAEDCTPEAPCTTLTYELDLEPGSHQILVEYLTATGSTFRTSVFDLVVVTVA